MATKKQSTVRYHSLDVMRGLIVMASVLLYYLPDGGFEFARHAAWYNVTIIDYILPAFITIFGVSMALAYQQGMKWKGVLFRTLRLILYGLLFNALVDWTFDLHTLRLTGVLQLYAVLGLVVSLLIAYTRSWAVVLIPIVVILYIQGFIHWNASSGCVDGVPQMDCNVSGLIDPLIFGTEHLYRQGTAGYDPEGVMTILGAMGNILLGLMAGRILLALKGKSALVPLLVLGSIALFIGLQVADILPLNKKIWTPSFALVTAGATIMLLSLLHLLVDSTKQGKMPVLIWFVESFGRNAFLIYFGKFILFSVLTRFSWGVITEEKTIYQWLYGLFETYIPQPQVMFMLLMFGVWSVVAVLLHKQKWYFRA